MELNILEKFLVSAGVIAGLTATWHLLMIIGGVGWYGFARAPQYIIESANAKTLLAPMAAIGIAILMFTCATYAFSGAGVIRKIPLLKSALIVISLICLARGVIISPLFYPVRLLGTWHLVASSVWFFVGICFLLGAVNAFAKN